MRTSSKGDNSSRFRRLPPFETDVPEYVSLVEVRAACKWAHDQFISGGIAALIGFLWGTGARISEALALTPADIDVERRMARIPTLKRRRKDGSGRKTSAARLVAVAGHWLTPVLGRIVKAQRGPHERIWPIGRQYAWRRISAALQAAQVEPGRAKPHALRHGHAVHAVQQGVPLNVLQRQLGHKSIVMTAIYLRVTVQDVSQVYDACDW